MKLKLYKAALAPAALTMLAMTIQGCSALSCDDYMTYDAVLDTWVGSSLEDYEYRTGNHPYASMERPQDVIEYAFNTPYVSYDGTQQACKTWLDVDRSTGRIRGWRHEGECYMHGYCRG